MISSKLNVPVSVAAGTSTECLRYRDITIELAGTFVATVQFEGSVSGTSWESIGSALTAPGFASAANKAYVFIRARVTAYTSGTPVAYWAGHDER